MSRATVLILLLLANAEARAQQIQAVQRGDDPAGALQYFRTFRANPDGRIPVGARNAALAEMKRRWPAVRHGATLSTTPNFDASHQWVPLGPTPINSFGLIASGRLNAIAVDPNDPQRIFIGAAQGGVWRTTDGGTNWTPLTDSQCSLAMGSIALDPTNSNVIYAGTGELNNSQDSYYGCGVLKSTDGGDHWTQLGAASFVSGNNSSARISKIVVDRTNPSNLLVAASTGLWRSTDGGGSWTVMILNPVTGSPDRASDVIQDPTNPAVFYAAQGNAGGAANINGVWKSSDGGATWSILQGFPSTNVGRINLAASNAGSNGVNGVIWASASVASGSSFGQLLGIYSSVDGGTTWTVKNPGSPISGNTMCNGQCWYSMVIAADPVTPNLVYFGGLSLYKSADGGSSFTNIGLAIHVDQHAFDVNRETD